MKTIYRQGDVLIIKVDRDPIGSEWSEVPREGGRVVLAHGELTGHAHAIAERTATLYESKSTQDRLLQVGRAVILGHEEHDPIKLRKGTYIIRRQREYTPERIITVAD